LSGLTYPELVRELFPRLTGGIRWGLERTQRMLESVGDPHLRYRTVHVGGTNGKGSVAAGIASVLRRTGLRTGLYTSPHLCTFRERIQIDGVPISEVDLLAAAERLWPVVAREEPTFFETTTAIAFDAFARADVDIAVIEVGLGGRLDSTNVIRPDAVVLTNVSLDHVQLLGPTIESVAREKAGIIKAGVPVIAGESEGVAADVFRRRAAEVEAPLVLVRPDDLSGVETGLAGTRFTMDARWGSLDLRTPLPGVHQAMNAALAVRAIESLSIPSATREHVVDGIAAVRWPGRLQIEHVGRATWIFDVAHNVAGVEALNGALRAMAPPRPLVALVGVLGDKDWRGMLRPLYEVADAVVLTLAPTAPDDRRWEPAAVLAEVPSPKAVVIEDFNAALMHAHDLATRASSGSVVVTGSFHTVGDALAVLRLAPHGVDTPLPVLTFAA
jgi:dihydrofolate synthase/folylpolyglutamate synthase